VEKLLLWLGWIGFSLGLMPRWGLVAIPIGYFIANIVLAMVSLVYQRLSMNFRLTKANLWLLTKLLPLMGIGIVGTQLIESLTLRFLFAAIMVGGMLILLPDATERRRAVDWLASNIFSLPRNRSH
jgi:hypothetical protein